MPASRRQRPSVPRDTCSAQGPRNASSSSLDCCCHQPTTAAAPRTALCRATKLHGRSDVRAAASEQGESERARKPALGERPVRHAQLRFMTRSCTAAQVEKYRPRTLDDVVAHKEIVDTSACVQCPPPQQRTELSRQSRASQRKIGCRTCCSMVLQAPARPQQFLRWRARSTAPHHAR